MDALLAEEVLFVAGGLRIRDTDTEMTVMPGCCAGLEDWRDWAQVLSGVSPWSGHDPGPEVEFLADRLRVWQDGGPGRQHGCWAGVYVDIPRSALPALLMRVHRDLAGFLGVLRGWAQRIGLGRRGQALVEALDRSFTVSAAFELPVMPATLPAHSHPPRPIVVE